MFHSSFDCSVVIRNWGSQPPTGQQMKANLAAFLQSEEPDAMLAREMGRSSDYVRWCLNSEAIVLASLLTAASRLTISPLSIGP
ncbi:hypothetical protein GGC47_005514 [Bosea sp. OAE752]|uniref:hypothetical protein n=1 Tax=Bosea sp. OAE752 TaxID=2663873 RepID=UPI003D1CAFAA